MLFRTELALSPFPAQLSLHSKILSAGSCFAEVIGNRLRFNKFQVIINPFGTIFNPVSITRLLETSITSQKVTESLMIEREGRWFHYDFHSSISGSDKADLSAQISRQTALTGAHLSQTDWLILTLGTAYIYRLKYSGDLVANCHKIAAPLFTKELLSITHIVEAITSLSEQLASIRPGLQILLTVSPVRHIKDGIPENQVSKSVLRLACHQLIEQFSQIHYFPSYELMMDDLRDYRFYKKDMIHPSETAEDYIWDKFVQALVDAPGKAFIKEWQSVSQALAHQSFHPQTETHQRFLRQTLNRLKALSDKVDVSEEIKKIEDQIIY